ncbi:MAG TPA: tryptophan synthase subunit alpha [Chitinophagaceae bacterium]|nr:tryptophan synthase subunit alpha [Chitinophagaceae bacterium]
MGRIGDLLQKKRPVLSIYCTAGFPRRESTREVMCALQEHGADMIELGIPFSDPLADGPVIQQSNRVALSNGMSIRTLLQDLQQMRREIHLPVLLMGYLNPVLQFGFERFCAAAASAGVDGLILPDVPLREFETRYRKIIEANGLDFVYLVTPETSAQRVRELDRSSSGFLYAVSSSSITGGSRPLAAVTGYLSRLRAMQLHNPLLVGFGIADRQAYYQLSQTADGVVIGSAYIRAISNATNVNEATKTFLSSILGR